ncbi:MAG TPA: serine/threonine-protein kinase, partial [Polyangiaceae bacterium]|nr:serine/threonine-protein kinase [Polyangiaceae bacterium]
MPIDTPKVVRASAPPISTGRVIGDKFEVCGVLGEGGTGIVYEARRLDEGGVANGEPVALKVIHGHLMFDKQIRGRFTREAKILSRLSGPHLCPVLDYGEVPDPHGEGVSLVYIALPKIVGPPLDQLLREQGAPGIDQALDIVIQVCTALSSAHAQGVIHRDLKPGNVLLKDGKEVVVVDFGMAKILTGGGTGTTGLTAHNMVFGTPEYMAPEQARGDELDARCDIYAVGVMLYELVTGKVPFTGNTPLNVLTAQLTEPPESPRQRAPERGISPALEAVIMHALAKDPRDRYPTAAAFAVAIAHAQSHPDDVAGVTPQRAAVGAGVQLVRRSDDMVHAVTLPGPAPAASKPS